MVDVSLPIDITIVRDDTGEICGQANSTLRNAHLQRGSAPEGVNTYIVEGIWKHADWYGVDGQLIERPNYFDQVEYTINADGIDSIHFDIPEGTNIIYIRDGIYKGTSARIESLEIVDEEGIIFSTTVPGTYEFVVKMPFPYKEQRLKVVAND